MLTLHYAPNTCALASLIALEETGAPYDTVRIDFASEMQRSPDFLALNPKGRVPVLVTEEGALTETPAILAYLGVRFPGARLVPEEPFAFARMQAINSYLCSTLHVAHAHRMRGYRWADDAAAIASMQRKVPEAVTEAYRYIEDHVLDEPYLLGARYSLADGYLFTIAQWMENDGVVVDDFPKVAAHRERTRAREGVGRALMVEGGV